MISKERLMRDFAVMKEITAPGEGITRLAFSAEDWEGRAYLMRQMEAARLTLREDAFGNVIGHYTGQDESLPALMCGSHSDSVPQGGNYDGLAGVLAAIETVRSMGEDGFPPGHPPAGVFFFCGGGSPLFSGAPGGPGPRGGGRKGGVAFLPREGGKGVYSGF